MLSSSTALTTSNLEGQKQREEKANSVPFRLPGCHAAAFWVEGGELSLQREEGPRGEMRKRDRFGYDGSISAVGLVEENATDGSVLFPPIRSLPQEPVVADSG